VWWFGVSDDGGEGGGVMMGRDMGGRKGNDMVDSCGLCEDVGWMLGGRTVGEHGGCLLSGGESVWGVVVFTFLLAILVHMGFGVFW